MRALTVLAAAIALLTAQQARAITISSENPGNVFQAGEPITLTVNGARGSVSYRLVDYFGSRVARGRASVADGAAHIQIAGRDPGWYTITCAEGVESAEAAVAVVINRGDSPLPADGRIGSDAASSWLIKNPDNHKPLAKMVRMAGIPWLRERFSWTDMQSEPGGITWGKYQAVLDAFSNEGIHVCNVWHDTPLWLHPTRPNEAHPDDLREVYRFTKALSAHFASQVQAWEVWNEADMGFQWQGGDTFAAFQKVAYHGFKDGNPSALVLNGAICAGVTCFVRNVYESGIGDYYDVFNWHTYTTPQLYSDQFAQHYRAMREENVSSRPAWLTECGIRLPGSEGEGNRILNNQRRHEQCQFVPRSISTALAAGTQRYFFFVLPDYLEIGIQFGALRPDLTTYPSFVALSAASNILGQARGYLGSHTSQAGDGLIARAFETPSGSVVVAWAERASELVLPTNKPGLTVCDIFGKQTFEPAGGGEVRVKVGPEAVYVMGVGNESLRLFTGGGAYPGKLPKLKPSRIVVAGFTDLPVSKTNNCYTVPATPTIDFTVDVYNLNEKARATGTVSVSVPGDWAVSDAERAVSVVPMGKLTLKFRLTPGNSDLSATKVTVTPRFPGENVAPSVSYFVLDAARVPPVAEKPLDWANATQWKPECAENGSVTVTNGAPGTLLLDARFFGEGDRWAYPELKLDSTLDLTGYDGISFDLKTSISDSNAMVRMMLIESDGDLRPHYMHGVRPTGDARRVVLLFRDMQPLGVKGQDPNGRLDLDRLTGIKIGCNTFRDAMSLEVSNFKAVKLK